MERAEQDADSPPTWRKRKDWFLEMHGIANNQIDGHVSERSAGQKPGKVIVSTGLYI